MQEVEQRMEQLPNEYVELGFGRRLETLLCVSGLAHWGFRYGQALKRCAYIIAN